MEYRIVDHYHYLIPGPPIPLKRARSSKGRFYDPQAKEKEKVMSYLKYHEKARPIKDMALSVAFEFFMQIPKSWSKRKQAAYNGVPHIQRIDIDNIIKFYLDVGNKILWDDDCLIYNLKAVKIWSYEPRTEIKINI